MKIALSIAGSDSGGGAGIQADLLTFAAHAVHGTTAITAITAQNTVTVTGWQALDPKMVRAQIEAVADDMEISALKTGMLANRAIIEEVAGDDEHLSGMFLAQRGNRLDARLEIVRAVDGILDDAAHVV